MSDLYKEAIAEARKLRQVAEDDAKKSIAEGLAPYIKKVISEQIGGATNSHFFIEEEEQQPLPGGNPADPSAPVDDLSGLEPGGETASDPALTDPMATDDLAAGLGDQPEAAPLGANGEDILSATMPDEEGKITVDFEDLFSDDEDASATPASGDDLDLGELPGAAPPATADPSPLAPSPPEGPEGLDGLELPPEEEEEQPLPTESVVYENFEKSLHKVSEKIDRVFFKDSVNELVHESLKTSLFTLLEQHDALKEAGIISSNKAKSNENKLEFLFLKLKEANSSNTYNGRDQKDPSMTSLKEYAAKLFEEDSTYADDGDKERTNHSTTADGKHAADVSGVDPNLGSSGPEDLEGREEDGNSGAIHEEMLPGTAGSVDHEPLPNTDPKPGAEEHWASGEPSLDEEDQDKVIEEALNSLEEEVEAEGHAGFGDTNEDPHVEFEVNDKEIAEAVRSIRKKSIQEKLRALREASDGKAGGESWEDADPEGGDDPSHENLKEGTDMDDDSELNEMPDYMDDDDDGDDEVDVGVDSGLEDGDADVDMMDMGGESDGSLVLNIDLPDAVEDALADVDISDMGDIEVSVADINLGDEGMDDMGDDADVDMVMHDDEEGAPAMDDMDDMSDIGGPPPSPEDDDDMEESFQGERAVYEARLRKASKIVKALKEQNEKYKNDLREANLFLAKNVYFTKFLQKENLSKKNLTKIVEYLDGAKTVKEAKTVYGKIKAKLAESANNASKKLPGSASMATKQGSATTSLNESANHRPDPNSPTQTSTRWQLLANIKPRKS